MEIPTTLCSGIFSFASDPVEMTMTDIRAATSKLLTQLLSSHSPELGARLKQRLNAAFVASGQGFFDEKSLGFAKFTDYLLRVHGDLVSVEREDGIGDILVSLRTPVRQQSAVSPTQLVAATESAVAPAVIRNDVWQAFANPDPKRKRFFNKKTGKIVHFLDDKQVPERVEVDSAPDDYLEICPISQETQTGWMQEFLKQIAVPADEKDVLEALIAKSYSSAVNVTFSRALGAQGSAWRKFRTLRVTAIIEKWAQEKGVLLSKFHVTAAEPSIVTVTMNSTEGKGTGSSAEQVNPDQLSPREQVVKLLELLSDDDILRLVIPTLLSTILIKSRM